MALGPGSYDDEVTFLMHATQAQAVILQVYGGRKGDGFSVQARDDIAVELPHILRQLANEIEQDLPLA